MKQRESSKYWFLMMILLIFIQKSYFLFFIQSLLFNSTTICLSSNLKLSRKTWHLKQFRKFDVAKMFQYFIYFTFSKTFRENYFFIFLKRLKWTFTKFQNWTHVNFTINFDVKFKNCNIINCNLSSNLMKKKINEFVIFDRLNIKIKLIKMSIDFLIDFLIKNLINNIDHFFYFYFLFSFSSFWLKFLKNILFIYMNYCWNSNNVSWLTTYDICMNIFNFKFQIKKRFRINWWNWMMTRIWNKLFNNIINKINFSIIW